MKKKIFVFGRGYYYKLKKEQIMGKYSIDGFLDNKIIVGREEMFDGLPAYNPIFLKHHPDVIVIIAVSRGVIDVYYQIKKMGIVDDNIVFCKNFFHTITCNSFFFRRNLVLQIYHFKII